MNQNSKAISLGICIATYNRADKLHETISSILVAYNNNIIDLEIVIVDGNSSDSTESVVKKFSSKYLFIKYFKLKEKGGVDKDFDIAVRHSTKEYCWLLSDDDIISGNSFDFLNLNILQYYPSLVIINSACWNSTFGIQLNERNINIKENILISESNFSITLFKITGHYLSYIGAILIKRILWINVKSNDFYGSRFIHIGILSKIPSNTKVLILSNPLIKIRLGNAEWTNISFKIWFHLWPSILNNFNKSNEPIIKKLQFRTVKSKIGLFFYHRALNTYNFETFKENILKNENFFVVMFSFLILLIPSKFFRLFYFLRYKMTNNLVGLYNINEGRLSNNNWNSEK
jgi:abequosyltransferase